jgi:RimJ/RimL family protein N-acetyltransferase
MIRPATFSEIPRLVDLLEEMCAESKYAGRVNVDRRAAGALLQQCVTRHNGKHEGGAWVMVDDRDGIAEGFMVGLLDRVYHIGDKLSAKDIYLHATKRAGQASALRLFRSYVDWAASNPKVIEINGSWTDALPGAERIALVYQKLGFRKCGEIFERAAT